MTDPPTLWQVSGGGLSSLGGASLNVSTENNNLALALVAVLFVIVLWRKV